jgi:hypothetical protein
MHIDDRNVTRLPKNNLRSLEDIHRDDVETGMAELTGQVVRERTLPVAAALPPMPDYVEHQENVPPVGKLTAEALVRDYEATAKEIEIMGKELLELQKRMEAETQNIHQVIEDVKGLAKRYRDEGKAIFKRLEDAALMTQLVREKCGELTEKLNQTAS